MYKYHLKIFFRNIGKQKFITFINITGLALGITATILIYAFVSHELNYDKSFKDYNNIYRVMRNWQGGDELRLSVPPTLGEALKKQFHEIEETTRLNMLDDRIVLKDNRVFIEPSIYIVDSTFFSVLGMDLLKGDEREALKDPYSVTISESAALKYFGEDDPMNQTLQLEGEENTYPDKMTFKITGVFKDFPSDSHMKTDVIMSNGTFWVTTVTNPTNHVTYMYVRLKNMDDELVIEDQLPEFMEEFYGTDYYNYSRCTYYLQPITDIHLNASVNYGGYETPKGNYTNIYIFPVLALFIILISSINFVNLSISQSLGRRKEVSIKKISGAGSRQQFVLFIFDSIFLCLMALIISLLITELVFPYFTNLSNRSLLIRDYVNFQNLLVLIGFSIVLGIIAGIYPAFKFSNVKPIDLLIKNINAKSKGISFNSNLIILQFGICILLIIGSLTIYNQFQFIQKKINDGLSNENVLIIKNPWHIDNQSSFLNTLNNHTGVQSVSMADNVPGIDWFSTWGLPVDSAAEQSHVTLIYSDPNFLETLNMDLVTGRFLSEDIASDSLAIIMNESAIKRLGWQDDPVGKRYQLDKIYSVIGVVKDIHYESLHKTVEPMAILLVSGSNRFVLARINPENFQNTMNYISKTWKSFSPERPMEFSFLDTEFDFWYKTERNTGVIAGIFSAIGIFISCMGLLGLAIYITHNRTKEIGIRKVNGASIQQILVLLNSKFLKWIGIAFFISIPFGWLVMNKWLENFAYRTNIDWWIFLSAGLIVLFIALLTVSWHTTAAARKNPVEALRYE